MNAMNLEGAVALVTGASSGIGRATALRLHAAGAHVLVAGRDQAALDAVACAINGESLITDFSEPGAARALAEKAIAAAGRVDVLVNNAGIGWAGDATEIPDEDTERLVTVNLTAPMQLTATLLPGMLERGCGHVVMVTSIAGVTGVAREAVYAATKSGLATYAASVRLETAPHGVGVTALAPGVIATAFFDRRNRGYDRSWPRPIPAERVAAALVTAVARNRAEVFVPGWLGLPARLAGGAPTVYRSLAQRFG